MYKAKIICEIAGSFKSFQDAKMLIDDLKLNKQTIVKLQTFNPETLASDDALFDMQNTGKVKQKEIFYKEMCPYNLQEEIIEYCKKKCYDVLFNTITQR